MNIGVQVLVAVKRVPETGGRIEPDRRRRSEIDTRYLGLHGQPARGVRASRRPSGWSRRTAAARRVLTLGPAAAEEQLRDGDGDRRSTGRSCSRRTAGEWDPGRDGGGDRRRDPGRGGGGHGPTTCSCSATRRPTRATSRSAIRVAVALGLPCVSGVKALEITDGRGCRAGARRGGGWETFEVPCRRSSASARGSTCRAIRRCRAACGRRRRRSSGRRWPRPARAGLGQDWAARCPASSGLRRSRSWRRGAGRGASAPAVVDMLERIGCWSHDERLGAGKVRSNWSSNRSGAA